MPNGWRKDKWDGRDYMHRPRLPRLPSTVDLSLLLPPVPDQGNTNQCVGEGASEVIYGAYKSVKAPADGYSPAWSYNGARAIEGTLEQDIGCSPKDALEWNLKHGCLHEQYWPRAAFDMAAPSSERMAKAVKYDRFAYYRIGDDAMGICQALADSAAALAAGTPAWLVMLGGPWFFSWSMPKDGALASVTTDDLYSGHEICFYGYDLRLEVFHLQNSWGLAWAKGGRATMPMSALSVMKQLGGYDAHYVTFDARAIAPTPTPQPTPSSCKWGNGLAAALNLWPRAFSRQGRFTYENNRK